MRQSLPRLIASLGTAAILLAAAVWVHVQVEAYARAARAQRPPLRVQLPVEYIRTAALGFDLPMADLLWLRFVQNVPSEPPDPAVRDWLANQIDSVVTLDPNFRVVYNTGATVMGVLAASPRMALGLVERGMDRTRDDWRLPFSAGYLCFYELEDPACGATYMRATTSIPGHPPWVRGLAGRLMATAGDPDGAVSFLQEWHAITTDPVIKTELADRVKRAILARDLAHISKAVKAFRDEAGRPPQTLGALVLAGHLPSLPVEPFGGTYELSADGSVRTTSGEEALRVFQSTEDDPNRGGKDRKN